MNYPEAESIKHIVDDAKHVVVIQADNPDGDSLGSALALEQILSEVGKQVSLYCSVDMPSYLHYLAGWDRVVKEFPASFDASLIVDASTLTLLDRLSKSDSFGWLKSKPCVVLDHHATVENPIDFAAATVCDPTVSSTGELVYHLAKKLDWPIDATSGAGIMTAILGDTQGLTNSLTQTSTYHVMAELSELGVNRPELEELRRTASRMPETIYRYKGELIARTELHADGRVASVSIPQSEINDFSPLYNPAALIQFDMLQITGVELAIVFKHYDSGRTTGAIRANYHSPIAAELAEELGGGGHDFASGFKIEDGTPFEDIKDKCIKLASELLKRNENSDETV